MKGVELFSAQEQEKIREAIRQAELHTSGEIRVHLEKNCPEDVMDHAAFIFETLRMHKTDLRNGVLFYISVDDHKFAILGDAGINVRVEPDFWNRISANMKDRFAAGDYVEGLCEAIGKAGEQLKFHFPRSSSDVNELPDDISIGGNKKQE